MAEHKTTFPCFMCGRQFQMGPHRYDGTFISRYQISVCRACYESNWDGWAPHWGEHIVAHLKKNKLPIPERNARGWLPRD